MSNNILRRQDLDIKYIAVNKSGEYQVFDSKKECPEYSHIITQVNRHTRARASSVAYLAKLLVEADGYDSIASSQPQEHYGLCLDYLYFKDPEAFIKTEAATQEAFWNTQRLKHSSIVKSVEAYKHYAS